ncbi:signal transduction histidine kinase [Rathayibacter sp. PhB93]|jgi:signal transduction histidine kinase|uniref:sensor histidine kinase n=1 Tax=unclassified Rathayibacter TaxID=2609250 RepID=UPI000F4A5A45|nr:MULTISPECIES: HAMP domain-containing sensor histidine kinase [unclassified Rathayibacter]ROQ06244.1 signal transduction histidine kinase [Rathayibacter sp. PhB93]TDQ14001.1 signal transduction histidine kinase [Rathayibacter sp. PhB1]
MAAPSPLAAARAARRRSGALSIRARITVGSVAVATVLFALAAMLFYQVVTGIVERSERTILVSIEDEIRRDIAAGDVPRVRDSSTGQLYLAITPDGAVDATTMPTEVRRSVQAELRDRAADAVPRYTEVATATTRYLVRITAVEGEDGTWSVATARDQAASQLVLDDFAHVLVYAAIFLVVTFGLASWILTGAALAPVRRMRARADQIAADPTPGDQLPVVGTRDEIDELAETLNAFLAKQTASLAREKQMVSDASHELRTPLAALSAQLEIAHHRVEDPVAVDRVILDAQKSVDRLVRLASALLDISRIESRSARPASPFAELVDELVGAVDRTRLLAAESDVEIDYEIDEREPARLYAVATQDFGRVIDNLVRNAIQAIGHGGTIVAALAQKDGRLLLTVSDDGPGMPAEFIPVAFDRFSRPDDSRTIASGGSGLGLALVHTTVLSGGGTVALSNREPHGLAVDIVLPPVGSAAR